MDRSRTTAGCKPEAPSQWRQECHYCTANSKKTGGTMNNTLFGWSSTTLVLLLAALTGGALLVALGLGASNALLWRMGLRNVARRPGQTLIMLAGLTLAATFITASFGLQDSFNQS